MSPNSNSNSSKVVVVSEAENKFNISYKNEFGVTHFPRHFCIIPDGNRRWARENNISVLKVHDLAVDRLVPVLEDVLKSTDIEIITLWGLSTENLARTPGEVSAIYDVIFKFVPKFLPLCHKYKVRICRIGSEVGLPQEVVELFENARKESQNYTTRKVNIALNYGGRKDIVEAVNQFIAKNKPGTEIKIDDINQLISTGKDKYPEPELILRTGADSICLRTSGFLTWQGMDANYYFTKILAPELTFNDMFEAFIEYENLTVSKKELK